MQIRSDIVNVFADHCNTLGYRFSYGNNANHNLLDGNIDTEKVYLLLDPVRRKSNRGEYGGIGTKQYNGQFMLLKQSDLDEVYHNQSEDQIFFNRLRSQDGGAIYENACSPYTEEKSKYRNQIEPILKHLYDVEELFNCSDYEIQNWEAIDIVNALDVNMDGVVVTFQFVVL